MDRKIFDKSLDDDCTFINQNDFFGSLFSSRNLDDVLITELSQLDDESNKELDSDFY